MEPGRRIPESAGGREAAPTGIDARVQAPVARVSDTLFIVVLEAAVGQGQTVPEVDVVENDIGSRGHRRSGASHGDCDRVRTGTQIAIDAALRRVIAAVEIQRIDYCAVDGHIGLAAVVIPDKTQAQPVAVEIEADHITGLRGVDRFALARPGTEHVAGGFPSRCCMRQRQSVEAQRRMIGFVSGHVGHRRIGVDERRDPGRVDSIDDGRILIADDGQHVIPRTETLVGEHARFRREGKHGFVEIDDVQRLAIDVELDPTAIGVGDRVQTEGIAGKGKPGRTTGRAQIGAAAGPGIARAGPAIADEQACIGLLDSAFRKKRPVTRIGIVELNARIGRQRIGRPGHDKLYRMYPSAQARKSQCDRGLLSTIEIEHTLAEPIDQHLDLAAEAIRDETEIDPGTAEVELRGIACAPGAGVPGPTGTRQGDGRPRPCQCPFDIILLIAQEARRQRRESPTAAGGNRRAGDLI